MGDSFFGFSTELPSEKLDKYSGRSDDLEPGCIEEEYDALNDETFGSGAIDGDWEEDHEKLALLIDKGKRQSSNASSHFYFDDSVLDGEDSQQEIVQKSISQLGLEDDLDDPAIMTVGRRHFSSHPVQTFFRQSPPPPAILEAECGSPKTHSIWSTTHSTPAKDSGLGSLLQSMTRSSSSSYQDSSLSSDVFRSPFQRKAWTVEEVERNLLSSNKSPCSSSPGSDYTPNHLVPNDTHKSEKEQNDISVTSHLKNDWMAGGDCDKSEFLKHENLKDRWVMRTPPLPLSSGVRTLDDVEKDILLKPRAQTVDDVERLLQSGSAVNRNALAEAQSVLNHRGLPSPIGVNLRAPVGTTQSSPPSVMTMPAKPSFPLAGANMFPVGRQPHPLLTSRPVGNLYPNMPGGIPWIPPGLQSSGRRFPGVPSAYRPMPERLQCDPRIVNHPFLQRQLFNNSMNNISCMENRGDFNNRRYPASKSVPDAHIDQEQEYCGLMSQKEKDWLIRIQMTLLQVDDPYNQDYYYSTYTANKYAKMSKKSPGSDGEEPTLILPERTKPEVKAYVPAHFEGSLGKLQAVSVNFPRKVIDVMVSRHFEEEEGRAVANQSLLKYRRLLLDIEKLYTVLLEIGDEERRIAALPDEAQIPHKDNVVNLTQKIFLGLGCEVFADDTFQNVMSVRKGRNLVMRVFRLFSRDQQVCFLEALFHRFPVILKKDQCDMVLMQNCPMILASIKKLTLDELVKLGESLGSLQVSETTIIISQLKEKSSFIPALKNKFGTSVICCMFQKAEEIYSGYDLLESEMQTRWAKVVLHAVDILCTLPDDSIVPPIEPCIDLLVHFQRFAVDRDKFEVLRSKVKVFQCDLNDNDSAT